MIPEIRKIKMNLSLFERGLEEFMQEVEQVKSNSIELAKENALLKQRIAELEKKLNDNCHNKDKNN